jgi:predicted enzyme related to lactoylglutathione lyase
MNGIRYITINLSNIEEIISECKKNNIVIVNEPIEIRPKVTVAVIQDPDGNLIEMMQSN